MSDDGPRQVVLWSAGSLAVGFTVGMLVAMVIFEATAETRCPEGACRNAGASCQQAERKCRSSVEHWKRALRRMDGGEP